MQTSFFNFEYSLEWKVPTWQICTFTQADLQMSSFTPKKVSINANVYFDFWPISLEVNIIIITVIFLDKKLLMDLNKNMSKPHFWQIVSYWVFFVTICDMWSVIWKMWNFIHVTCCLETFNGQCLLSLKKRFLCQLHTILVLYSSEASYTARSQVSFTFCPFLTTFFVSNCQYLWNNISLHSVYLKLYLSTFHHSIIVWECKPVFKISIKK